MSVAFRRESDEEHLEPRFELPIPAGPNFVTPTGLALIEARVGELEAVVAQEKEPMRLAEAQRDLRYWRTRLATSLPGPTPPEGEVGFGSRVRFRMKGTIRTLDIVGDDEADPPEGRIAFSAPLARALIGAEAGDMADFGGETDAIEVIEVAPIA
ncbi:GreA/GreB family elongation factor [Sphingomonas sp. LY54]|uniref:GreA/GreB family elongation factor n=1 Tax=Sphingomonas sp. LY54 TaxID=3095343 RepID=UPI002D78F510|nr:GreA/GreB family elongation factor [Sphingomonas sp. LY54]WRP28384.1 GreA/GreB family elongation factor [Sphingomonas sp. LY54]